MPQAPSCTGLSPLVCEGSEDAQPCKALIPSPEGEGRELSWGAEVNVGSCFSSQPYGRFA